MLAFPRNPKKEKVATPQEERIFTPLTRKVRIGDQRCAQAIEGGAEASVNLLRRRQQSTGEQCRDGQQNSGARQILCRGKQGQRVVEQPQGGPETIQGAVQRIGIEALSRRFAPWFFPLGRWRWWRGE